MIARLSCDRAPLRARGVIGILALAGLAMMPAGVHAATPWTAPVERTLGNGLRVVVFPDTRLELVHVHLRVPAGLAAEPQDSPGVAHVTAEMLRRGTTLRDAREFATAVERTGGNMATNVTRDFTTIGGTFLARDFETGLELVSDAALHPVFDDEELRRVKVQTLRFNAQVQQSPDLSAEDQVWKAVFGAHPYSRARYGDPNVVGALDAARVRQFWSQLWRPDGAVLVIAGDVTPQRAFLSAEEWLGKWTGDIGKPAAAAAPQPVGRPRIRILDRPGPRSELRIGALGPARGDEGSFAMLAASSLLGGVPARHPNGQLTVYGRPVRTGYISLENAGLFTIAVNVAADSVGQAVRTLNGMLTALGTPASSEDLVSVRRLIKNRFAMSIETLAARTWNWLTVDSHERANESFDRHDEIVDALTADAVAAAGRRWLDPSHVAIVATGPAARLRTQLEGLGDIEVVTREGAPPPAVEAAPSAPAPARAPSPADITRGRELVRKAVVAHGGVTKLRAVKNSRMEALIALNVGGNRLEGTIVQARRDPDRMVFLREIGGIASRQTLVGNRGWQMSMSDSVASDMDSLDVESLRSSFSSDLQHLLFTASDPKSKVWASGRVMIDSVNAHAVVVNHPVLGNRTLYLDPVRNRLFAFDQGEGATGLLARRKFSDFRSVGGILWPYREERLLNGETVMVVEVQEVQFNTDIADSAFEKPTGPLSR